MNEPKRWLDDSGASGQLKELLGSFPRSTAIPAAALAKLQRVMAENVPSTPDSSTPDSSTPDSSTPDSSTPTAAAPDPSAQVASSGASAGGTVATKTGIAGAWAAKAAITAALAGAIAIGWVATRKPAVEAAGPLRTETDHVSLALHTAPVNAGSPADIASEQTTGATPFADAPPFAGAPPSADVPPSSAKAEPFASAAALADERPATRARSTSATANQAAQAVDAHELRAEAALLEQARQALAHSPESAERILRDFEVRFRTPALGFERDLLRIETLAALGETKRALSQARALQRKSPNSVYGDRVAALVTRLESSSSRENPPASMKDSGRIGNQ